MNTHADKTQENKSQSVANRESQMQSGGESTFQFVDNRPEAVAQRKLQEMANNSPKAKQTAQLQAIADNLSTQQQEPIQKKENNTGLPDNLKTGMENLSGMTLDDVKVHRNSDKPSQLQAHAYAQGTDIHLGPGQEKHLPHEAWHVVQQKQGRVKPTMQMKGKVNDDAGLEKEADVMGAKAIQLVGQDTNVISHTGHNNPIASSSGVELIQRVTNIEHSHENREFKELEEKNQETHTVGVEMNAYLDPDDVVTGSAVPFLQLQKMANNSPEAKQAPQKQPIQKMKNGTTQLAKEKTQVYGITHLIRMVGGSIYNEDFISNEYCEVSDEDVVEIESDVSVFSRRGPNQEVTRFNKEDSNGPQHYLWYLVKSINDEMVDDNIFIREDTFHKIKVKPTAKTIGKFFNWLHSGKTPDLSALSIDAEKLRLNRAAYLLEFRTRLKRLNPSIDDSFIDPLFEKLIEVFVRKDEALARSFLASLTSEAGLTPLEQESERLYWSGKESRTKAYEISQDPPGATALEKTQIGQLLDKFPFFESIPWDLSTILWAEVSRCFSIGSRGTMNVYIDGGFAKGNVFWNDELPALRLMQNYGLVDNIVIHIWHTKDHRWVSEFDIQSENLNMVFNKAIRISAPTPEKPENTRSYRYDNPINVSVVRKILMRYLQSLERDKPLIFHKFRLESGVFADAIKTDYGMEVSFFNYGSEAKKITQIDARDGDLEKLIKSAEFYLMANCTDYESIPRGLVFSQTEIRSGTKIIAKKAQGKWVYN